MPVVLKYAARCDDALVRTDQILPNPSSPMRINSGSFQPFVFFLLRGEKSFEFIDASDVIWWSEIHSNLCRTRRFRARRHFCNHPCRFFTVFAQSLVLNA